VRKTRNDCVRYSLVTTELSKETAFIFLTYAYKEITVDQQLYSITQRIISGDVAIGAGNSVARRLALRPFHCCSR
jgi:hypothetical protein